MSKETNAKLANKANDKLPWRWEQNINKSTWRTKSKRKCYGDEQFLTNWVASFIEAHWWNVAFSFLCSSIFIYLYSCHRHQKPTGPQMLHWLQCFWHHDILSHLTSCRWKKIFNVRQAAGPVLRYKGNSFVCSLWHLLLNHMRSPLSSFSSHIIIQRQRLLPSLRAL